MTMKIVGRGILMHLAYVILAPWFLLWSIALISRACILSKRVFGKVDFGGYLGAWVEGVKEGYLYNMHFVKYGTLPD